jgi:hypothetical protein
MPNSDGRCPLWQVPITHAQYARSFWGKFEHRVDRAVSWWCSEEGAAHRAANKQLVSELPGRQPAILQSDMHALHARRDRLGLARGF